MWILKSKKIKTIDKYSKVTVAISSDIPHLFVLRIRKVFFVEISQNCVGLNFKKLLYSNYFPIGQTILQFCRW